MAARHSSTYLAVTGVLLFLLATLAVHARYGAKAAGPALDGMARLVGSLELTDLCLFTEASYTRHLAMADLTTPFQDSPFAFEHFPTGALVGPPEQIVRNHGQRH
jgi:hypothetical protein